MIKYLWLGNKETRTLGDSHAHSLSVGMGSTVLSQTLLARRESPDEHLNFLPSEMYI